MTDTLSAKGLFGGLLSERKCSADELRELFTERLAEAAVALVDDFDWRRGGAETYISAGTIRLEHGRCLKVIGKAFVGWGGPPIDQQARWEARRAEVEKHGVDVPKVILTLPALTVEQFIASDAPAISALDTHQAFALGRIASSLAALKLRPLSIMADVREEAGKLFYVDFGSDLIPSGDDYSWIEGLANQIPIGLKDAFDLGRQTAGRSH